MMTPAHKNNHDKLMTELKNRFSRLRTTQLMLEAYDPLVKFFENQPRTLKGTKRLVEFGSMHRVFHSSVRCELEARKIAELIQRIAWGEKREVEKLLLLFPHLLLNKEGKAADYSEREIVNLTPLQAALCAGDVDMCNMIKGIFLSNPVKTGGQEEMIRQFNEIFPLETGGLAGHLARQIENVFDFGAIVSAFQNATPAWVTGALNNEYPGAQFTEADDARPKPNNQLTLVEALNRFREQFAQRSRHEIVFNPQHLLRAFEVYVTQFNGWGWDTDKRNLFWRQVIGFVQRFLPACDAQAFAQGLCELVTNSKALRRSLYFNYNERSFYPDGPYSLLGFDYAADGAGQRAVCGPEPGIDYYKIYIEQKHTAWRTYAGQPCTCDLVRNFIK